jgi:hypothetical protein
MFRLLKLGWFTDHRPLQQELVSVIPAPLPVGVCDTAAADLPIGLHGPLLSVAIVRFTLRKNCDHCQSARLPSGLSAPGEPKLTPAGQAEFVICDHTIETFFSDQKSRGFHLHKSHLADPQRLARLLIAACLAYIWMIYLGTLCQQQGWRKVIHRTDRCDLSLFQLGLDLLDYFENEGKRIPVDFKPYHEPLSIKTVR